LQPTELLPEPQIYGYLRPEVLISKKMYSGTFPTLMYLLDITGSIVPLAMNSAINK